VIPHIRHATPDELPEIAAVAGRAFGIVYSQRDLDDFRPRFEPERYIVACDPTDGAIVGVTCSFPFEVTLPGGAAVPAPGVSWVSVSATHRRRGILRALMAKQHRDFVADGSVVSVLTASESGIYGRFGYGQAAVRRNVEIDRRAAAFRPGVPDPGGVRYVDAAQARSLAPDVHRRWCAITPGALSRDDRWWDDIMLDREHRRGGATTLYHLVHADGYASYRRAHSDDSCRVVDLFTTTDEAHAAIWRVLLGLDLVKTVKTSLCALDDPLPLLLTDQRLVRTTEVYDGLWARIIDVPAALTARRYAVELDVVVDVADDFLDRGGRFRIRGGPDGATCERVDAAPGLRLDVATLGSLLLGAHRAHTLARAGRITVDDPAALHRADTAFVPERSAEHGTNF
jgi:predicted acetyltransferase